MPGGGRGLQNRWAVRKPRGRWVRFPCTSAILLRTGSQGRVSVDARPFPVTARRCSLRSFGNSFSAPAALHFVACW